LERIYDRIDLALTTVGRNTEITAIFAAGALVLILAAAGLSMRWYGRVI
jgi:Ca-activated chloride channel family protein